MSEKDEKYTAEDEAVAEVYELVGKVLPSSVITMFKRFTGVTFDVWKMSEKIMGISQRYVERKIDERLKEEKDGEALEG